MGYQVGHLPIGTGIELDQLLWKGCRLPASFIERATCLPPVGRWLAGGGDHPLPAPLRRESPHSMHAGYGFSHVETCFLGIGVQRPVRSELHIGKKTQIST